MREVLYDTEWFKTAPNLKLYYMYRGVARSQSDAVKIKKGGLRYDIIIIPAQMLGCEFVKTVGHDHTSVPGQKCTFTEIYEVISGQAIYLMQMFGGLTLDRGRVQALVRERTGDLTLVRDRRSKASIVQDVYTVYAQPGDKVIIPPNYGHVTINAANQDLVMSNWVADCFKSDYSLFRQQQGACYYALQANRRDRSRPVPTQEKELSLRGSETIEAIQRKAKGRPAQQNITWQPNKNYGLVPRLRFSQPTDFPEFGLNKNKPMYNSISNLSQLDFLKRPQDFNDLWQKIKSL